MLKKDTKTKEQLLNDIGKLNDKIVELEKSITERKRAEKALCGSGKRVRSLMESVPFGITISTPEGDISELNETIVKIFGYDSKEEFLNTPTEAHYYNSKDRERFVEKLSKKGLVKDLEVQFKHKDGSVFWGSINSVIVTTKTGNIEFINAFRDITERKHAKKGLQESEQRFKQIADSAGEWIWEVDTEGMYTYSSPVIEKILGYRPEEVVGKKHFYDFFRPDEIKELKKGTFSVFKMKESFTGFINANIRKDGREVILETNGVPILDKDGRLLGYRGADTDITKRKKAEKELVKMNKNLKMLGQTVSSMNECVSISDKKHKLIFVNNAFIETYGYKEEEIIGKASRILRVKENSKLIKEIRKKTKLGGWKGELLNKKKDGTIFPIELSITPLRDVNGKVYAQIGISTDITDRKQAEKELKHRLELENLIASISTNFISSTAKQLDVNINQTLQKIGVFLEVDRSYVFILSNDKTTMDKTHEWCGKGIEQQIENLKGIPVDAVPWGMEKLYKFENIYIRRVADLPLEASAEKEILEAQDIRSLIVLPLVVSDSLIGIIGFDSVRQERTWSDEHIQSLRLIGNVIINAMIREKASIKLKESEKRFRKLSQAAFEGIVIAEQGKILEVNTEFARMFGYELSEMIGMTVLDLTAPEYHNVVMTNIKRNYEKSYEAVAVRKNGSTLPFEANGVKISYNGRTARITAIRDITKRKRVEKELKKAFNEIKDLRDRLQAENVYLRKNIKPSILHEDIVGNSDPIKEVVAKALLVAPMDTTVLLLGETGTGKELLARGIHNASSYKDKTLVAVNCAAIPDSLIESELFGHKKGAYTDARSKKIGLFEVANGSTIFLDEIAELSLNSQAKLLRVIDKKEITRLGSNTPIKVNVRIIAATNQNLKKMVLEKKFRQDLYYRLNVYPINLPPLRTRKEDIQLLVEKFVNDFNFHMGKNIVNISKKNLKAIKRYPWPGNVRELRNHIERGMIQSTGRNLNIEIPSSKTTETTIFTTLQDLERQHIQHVLEATFWKVSGKNGAADKLGLNPSTLKSRMRKLGINRPTQ